MRIHQFTLYTFVVVVIYPADSTAKRVLGFTTLFSPPPSPFPILITLRRGGHSRPRERSVCVYYARCISCVIIIGALEEEERSPRRRRRGSDRVENNIIIILTKKKMLMRLAISYMCMYYINIMGTPTDVLPLRTSCGFRQ